MKTDLFTALARHEKWPEGIGLWCRSVIVVPVCRLNKNHLSEAFQRVAHRLLDFQD
jgi:hypothetical protein